MEWRSPRELAAAMERRTRLPGVEGERFAGYGVIGLPFTFGDVLAFRRHTASSLGPAHTTVWHRDPSHVWTVYTDTDPDRTVARYFGSAFQRTIRTEIELEWTDPHRVTVSLPEQRIEWTVRLESTARTRVINGMIAIVPRRLVAHPAGLRSLATVGTRLLGAGPVRLMGSTPGGYRYALHPLRVWAATAAAAVVEGDDMGPLRPHHRNARLGEYLLPNRGVFAAVHEVFRAPISPAPADPTVAGRSNASTPAGPAPVRRR